MKLANIKANMQLSKSLHINRLDAKLLVPRRRCKLTFNSRVSGPLAINLPLIEKAFESCCSDWSRASGAPRPLLFELADIILLCFGKQ